MAPTDAFAEADWQAHRPAVFGAAYRILGSVAEAEDVVQEVWLRAAAADLSEVRDLRAWLVTLAARGAYNVLKSARVRRESYVGPWLPEPLLTGPDAAAQVLMDESVSTAMLVVMETLSPAERVALVLHDRASRADTERLLKAFKAAADAGNLAELVELLHPEAVYVADGGGKVTAARRPVQGAAPIALLAVRQIEIRRPDAFQIIEVNGQPALVTYRGGQLVWLDTLEIADGRITTWRRLANPEKFAHIGPT
ncbi:sigma factor [Nonomuraea spiralis]|uniref:sigma factor n=1 Tax=Nonomuraea spiralis TaxID=46182 RepID=UPI0037B6EC4F